MRFRLCQLKKKSVKSSATDDVRPLGNEHGTVFQSYVERQLSDERERFASLEGKANSLISGSGTLVTLILAVGALSTNRGTFSLSPWFRLAAVVGLTLFVLAAIAGLTSIKTRPYSVPSADALAEIRKKKSIWTRTEPAARGIVIQFDISTIRSLREVNNKKAWWVTRGRTLQILATTILAVAAAIALTY